MKKSTSFVLFVFSLLLISFVTAGATFETQPNSVYNLGDRIDTTVRILTEDGSSQVASMLLICPNGDVEVYKEFLFGAKEGVKKISVPLEKGFIGNLSGECNFKFYFGENVEATTENFEISKKIIVDLQNGGHTYDPGQTVFFNGTAVKKNGENAQGFIGVEINGHNLTGEFFEGEFSINHTLGESLAAGEHTIKVHVYETDKGGKETNFGDSTFLYLVRHVPKSIEVFLEDKDINPGEELNGKVLLHDQTGEEITSLAYILITNSDEEELKRIEVNTGEEFVYRVNSTTLPGKVTVSATSDGLINRENFNVLEYKKVVAEIIENTMIITNVGNVFYNDTLNVSLGDQIVEVPVGLGVGESEKYTLSAPDGEYRVTVGDVEKVVSLTGNAVEVEKAGSSSFNVNPVIWVFVIFVLVFTTYFTFRKTYKRKHMAFAKEKMIKQKDKEEVQKKELAGFNKNKEVSLAHPSKKLDLSLSITGKRQDAGIVALSLKNYPEIENGEGNVSETFLEINKFVNENKGLVYENNQNMFFVFAPGVTKTFKNEEISLKVARKIKEFLEIHNKKFKKKIDYGLSVDYGSIVLKEEKGVFKFMALGTVLTIAKKLANSSLGEIYLAEAIKTKYGRNLEADKIEIGSLTAYKFKGLRDETKNSKFIDGFLERQRRQRENQEKKN